MKKGIGSDTASISKNLAKQIATQMANIPQEILESAADQVTSNQQEPDVHPDTSKGTPAQPEGGNTQEKQEQFKSTEKDLRRVEALEAEMKDIRDQRRIADEKKRQEYEAKVAASNEREQVVLQSQKPSRKFMGLGRRQQAEKQKTRIEKPLPPT